MSSGRPVLHLVLEPEGRVMAVRMNVSSRNALKGGIAALVAGALLLVSGPAQAGEINASTGTEVSAEAGLVAGAGVDEAIVAEIVANVRSEQAAGFERGERATVYQEGAVALDLVRTQTGAYQLEVGSDSLPLQANSFCHAAAMAAVYTIGAAAFAAAALLGGIVVFGVAISASAAGAFSAALAAGAGVSALVAVYIC